MAFVDDKGLKNELYFSNDAVNMGGEYRGLWVRWRAIEQACENNRVDAVKVIRCKDCKWFGKVGCAIEIVDDDDKPTENDYCSFAERENKNGTMDC